MLSSRRSRRLLRLRDDTSRPSFTEIQHNERRTAFDEATGHIYTETTARILSSRDRPWNQITKVIRSYAFHGTDKPGSRSLIDVAIEQIMFNIENITFELLEELPRHLLHRIWDKLYQRLRSYHSQYSTLTIDSCNISLKTWTLFARLLRNEISVAKDFIFYERRFATSQQPLSVFTKPLVSASFNFITSLCIGQPVPVAELLRISQIRNIGILEIADKNNGTLESGVTDRLMRGWRHSAITENAFPVLRILKLNGHDSLTEKSLDYINAFPALELFDVRKCGLSSSAKAIAKSRGWRSTEGRHLLEWLQDACRPPQEGKREDSSQVIIDTINHTNREPLRHVSPADLNTFWSESQDSMQIDTYRIQPQKERLSSLNPPLHRGHGSISADRLMSSQQDYYRMYARIGVYTANKDMIGAGVDIKNLLAQGNELLILLPVVFVTLGSGMHVSLTREGDRFVFIRDPANNREMPSATPVSQRDSQDAGTSQSMSTTTSRVKQSRKVTSVQNHKKKKLEDMLSMFS
jgi:hypothetical protein